MGVEAHFAGGVVALCWSMVLASVDLRKRRLPNALTLPAACIALSACFVHPHGWWGAVWPAAYVMLGRGIGGGDIKLAVTLGVMVALCGGVFAVMLAMLLSSLITVVLLVLAGKRDMAHGPSMLASSWIVGLACAYG